MKNIHVPETGTVSGLAMAQGVNAGFDALQQSIGGTLTKIVAGNSNVTLTQDEANNGIIVLTGALTGNVNVIVPTESLKWVFRNATTGSYSLTVKTAAGAGVAIPQGRSCALFCNGTDVLQVDGDMLMQAPEVDVASAGTTDIGAAASMNIRITGTTTITSFGTAAAGTVRNCRMAGALTLTHNATSLILPGGANITTAAGDCFEAESLGSGNWVVRGYTRADGEPLKARRGADIASAATINLTTATGDIVDVTGTTGITAITLADGMEKTVRFTGALTLTNGASLVLLSGANITTAAGDIATFRGYAAGVVRMTGFSRASGAALAGGGATVLGQFRNLQLSASGASANISVSADEVALEDGSNAYSIVRSASLTINSAGSGANGLDAGTLAASTWYAVWIVQKPDGTTAGLISTSSSAPTMPSGYTFKARVGWIRTDGTGNKYPLGFKQFGRRVRYTVGAGNVSAPPTIVSGAQGNPSTPTWVSAAIGNFVPSTACRIGILLAGGSSSDGGLAAPNNSYGAVGSSTNPAPVNNYPYGAASANSNENEFLIESANIYVASIGSGFKALCTGWEDNL